MRSDVMASYIALTADGNGNGIFAPYNTAHGVTNASDGFSPPMFRHNGPGNFIDEDLMNRTTNVPATRGEGSANFLFADGHVESVRVEEYLARANFRAGSDETMNFNPIDQ